MTDLAKSIIDSLKTSEPIDSQHHAHELHKHATNIKARQEAGEPHTAEVLHAFEHAVMLMQGLGLTGAVDEDGDGDADQTGADAEATNESVKTELPDDHKFIIVRKDRGDPEYLRRIETFLESFVTIEEAADYARGIERPTMIGEVLQREDGIIVAPRMLFTDDVDS